MKKATRELVKAKYGGKCAYCGCDLPERWHVDHIKPIHRNPDGTCEHPDRDNINNYNPACPSCNMMKSTCSIEVFRECIGKLMSSLNLRITQYKIAKRFGLLKETGKKVEFYYESYETTQIP